MTTLPPDALPACHGPCEQGRKPCPCPTACEISQDEEDDALALKFIIGLVLVGFLCAVSPAFWM